MQQVEETFTKFIKEYTNHSLSNDEFAATFDGN